MRVRSSSVRLLAQLQLRRGFADKGQTRRDFSDPGYQKQGYISASCFTYTHPASRFKQPHPGDIAPPSHRYEDADPSSITRLDYLRRQRKLGDARRRYEEELVRRPSPSTQPLPPLLLAAGREIDQAKEMEVKALPYRPQKKIKGKSHPLSRKRGFKGMSQDFSKFRFPCSSRLDEYTRKLAAKKHQDRSSASDCELSCEVPAESS